jgi:hypothetical protein
MSIGMVFKILRKVRVIRHVHSEIEAWRELEKPAVAKRLLAELDIPLDKN